MRRTKKVPDWDKIRLEVAIQCYALEAQHFHYTEEYYSRPEKNEGFKKSIENADAFVDRLKKKYAKENQQKY
jgi:hypothetical protein